MNVELAKQPTVDGGSKRPSGSTLRWWAYVRNAAIYAILIIFALIMIFPFLVMIFTSLKEPSDTFSYPPRLFPREQLTTTVEGYEEPLPLYYIDVDGQQARDGPCSEQHQNRCLCGPQQS